jgi:ribokinase
MEKKRHYQVITVGESTIDAFMTLAHANTSVRFDQETKDLCFRHGEKIDVDRYDFMIGGNATNVAVGLTRLGIKTALCSETGDDEFSIKIRNCLANEHIERVLVTQTNGPSSFSVIINYKSDRTIFVQDVARNHDFHFTEVAADVVYLTSLGNEWREPYEKALAFAQEHSARLAFNPGSRQLHEGRDFVRKIVRQTNILFVNKEEAELILFDKETTESERAYVEELLKKLQEKGAKTVVITDGKKGSYAMDKQGELFHQGTHPGEVVERTGAGDSYTSGFLAACLYGLPFQTAMLWGSWNATSVVGQIGAQAGLLKKDQMEEKVK